jgi:hypothetical protein
LRPFSALSAPQRFIIFSCDFSPRSPRFSGSLALQLLSPMSDQMFGQMFNTCRCIRATLNTPRTLPPAYQPAPPFSALSAPQR